MGCMVLLSPKGRHQAPCSSLQFNFDKTTLARRFLLSFTNIGLREVLQNLIHWLYLNFPPIPSN